MQAVIVTQGMCVASIAGLLVLTCLGEAHVRPWHFPNSVLNRFGFILMGKEMTAGLICARCMQVASMTGAKIDELKELVYANM